MTCRKEKDKAEIESFYTAKELPPEWDLFLPADHFLRKQNITVSEQSQLPDVSYVYTLVTTGSKIVAVAYFQLLRIRKKHLQTSSLKQWQAMLWGLFTQVAKPKLLVAGHLFRHDIESFHATPDISHFESYQVYKAAIDKVLAESCAQAVLVKDMPESLSTYFQHYAPKYIVLRNDITMHMDIPAEWQDMTGYEKALKHKYAQKFRKVRQAFQGVDVKELSQEDVNAAKDDIYALYLQVCERQQARIGYLSADYLPLLKQQYPDQLKVWGIYENSKIIAFFTAWVREDVFDMFYIGLDYERNAELQLYFNILFFSVEQAIHFRKSKLILGRTALDAKARLGCKPHYLSTFVYISNRYVRTAVQQVQARAITQEGEWEQRHPFKEAK